MADFDFTVPDNPVNFKIQSNVLRFRSNQPMMVFTNPMNDIIFEVGFACVGGESSGGLPGGGARGDVLVKQSSTNGDAIWTNTLDAGTF